MSLPFRDIQVGLADTWSTSNCFQGGPEALTGARSLLTHPTKSTWSRNCLSAGLFSVADPLRVVDGTQEPCLKMPVRKQTLLCTPGS